MDRSGKEELGGNGSQEGKERGGRKEGRPFNLEGEGSEGSIVCGGVGIGGIGHDDLEMGPDRVPIEVLIRLIGKVVVCNKN